MRSILFLLVFTSTRSEESSQYLHNAVRDLRQLNMQTLRRADLAMASSPVSHSAKNKQFYGRRYGSEQDHVPPLSLTKGELAALYESAVKKGETIKLDAGDDAYVHAAVHELDEDKPIPHTSDHDDNSGYYYYYYPIKTFLDEMTGQATHSHDSYKPSPPENPTTTRPPYQFHSHHHQHNITINKAMMEDKKSNKLEPLFMAISGFIGMAVMFIFSAIIMPKFNSKTNKNNKTRVFNKKDDDEFEDFARLALKAIDGECAERFACELSKTARNFNFQDNRFIKLLKRIAPGTFGNHIDRVGKYTNKLMKCTAIPCRKKNNVRNPKPQKNQKKKNPAQKRP